MGTRARKGPVTPFGRKGGPACYSLTRLAKDALDAAASRAETSRSNVVELLVRQHAAGVTAGDFVQNGSAA